MKRINIEITQTTRLTTVIKRINVVKNAITLDVKKFNSEMYSPDGQSAYNNLRHSIREQIMSSTMCSQTALRLTQILDDYTLDVNSIWNYDFHNLTDIIYDIRCFTYDFIYCESFDADKD